MAATLQEYTLNRELILGALIPRIERLLAQIQASLEAPGASRPSLHVAVPTVARYIVCGAILANVCCEWDEAVRSLLGRYAQRLARMAIVGTALYYYEQFALQNALLFSATDVHYNTAMGLVLTAWAVSLLKYPIPTSDVSSLGMLHCRGSLLLYRLRSPSGVRLLFIRPVIQTFWIPRHIPQLHTATRSRRSLASYFHNQDAYFLHCRWLSKVSWWRRSMLVTLIESCITMVVENWACG